MNVEIRYCGMCGGKSKADMVADELRTYMQIEPMLNDVGKGAFEVWASGKLLFSMPLVGRYPMHMEIINLLKKTFKAATGG